MNAGQFGFSGNAQQVDQEVTNNQFEASMANFMDAHRSTQSVVSNLTYTKYRLTNSIPQLHQQMKMMQLMMQQQINNAEKRIIWGTMGGTIITPTIWARRRNLARETVGMVAATGRNRWNGGGNSNSRGKIWNRGNSGGGGGKQRPYNVKLYNNNNNCWSHGHDLPSDHNSTNCNHQFPNHCTMETATNTMAGNPNN